jgi:hypothetical protein
MMDRQDRHLDAIRLDARAHALFDAAAECGPDSDCASQLQGLAQAANAAASAARAGGVAEYRYIRCRLGTDVSRDPLVYAVLSMGEREGWGEGEVLLQAVRFMMARHQDLLRRLASDLRVVVVKHEETKDGREESEDPQKGP